MLRPLKKTSKFYASTRKEAEEEIQKMINETEGSVIKQNIVSKNHKDFGDYYEAQVTEEFARSKEIVEGGFLAWERRKSFVEINKRLLWILRS